MNEAKRRALEEARADAAYERRVAAGQIARLVVRARSTAAFFRVALSAPWRNPGPREPLFAGTARDLRYALRRLRQSPGFTVFTVLSLAVAIGAATAVSSTVDAVMGPPPGVVDPERVLTVSHAPQGSAPIVSLSWPDYQDLRVRQDVFESLAAWRWFQAGYAINGIASSGIGEWVSGDYFRVHGVRARLGRTLGPADDEPAAPPVAVISHRLWQQAFAGSEDVLGQSIRVIGVEYAIIGVAAEDFRGLFNGGLAHTVVWLPMGSAALSPAFNGYGTFASDSRDRRWIVARGRLRAGQTLEQARAQVSAIAQQLDADFPLGRGLDSRFRLRYALSRDYWTVAPLSSRMFGVPDFMANRLGAAVLVAVGLVLLVAATNAANLAVARASRRKQDLSVRKALGASRFRLVRESLSESFMIAVASGALSLLVASALMRVIGSELSINGLTLQADPRFDWFTLVVTSAAAALVLVVAGLAPALVSTRDIRSAMASEGSTTAGRWRGRRYLITLQVGVSVLLVLLASVFVTHVRRQAGVDTGIDLDRMAIAEIDFGDQGYDETQVRQIANDVLARLRRPDVESASVSSGLPISLRNPGATLRGDGAAAPVELIASTPGIDKTLGLVVVEGRVFDQSDTSGQPAVVLSRLAATRAFGEGPAVGRSVVFRRGRWAGEPENWEKTLTVVGVVSDTDTGYAGSRDRGVAYVPFAEHYESRLVFSARAMGDGAPLIVVLRDAIAGVDSRLAVTQIGTGTTLAGPDTRFQRIFATIAGLLGVFALVLALAGLYGVMAHLVAARTREVGLRVALGATTGHIQRMVIRQGLSPVVLGLGGGLFAAFLGGMGLRATLSGLELPVEPLSLLAVIGLFLGAGLLACYLPARQASRVDPNKALRSL
ncbi:MAG: ABC transporter permease [Acidobacteria bacterium]|nr:ABC transporter permease [Acidobacteriota bacterium]